MLIFVLLLGSKHTFYGIKNQIKDGLKVLYNDFID